ncbi:Protein export cytoplasm chaperone protein [Methylophaga frappieri]|jgi:preprotein translocase subunit SecB|uniref:Protein-export protein SecB n=1 Tax=Methylophaga frappieri (strain ATCC BAA-2434 / DSM 25690 / JAM7) TaxID=754477 RepID=I1YJQ8_METFJ|nr:protein-export chaperone SecB [Methylophaga frappieri]AFJ03151.1 Protein export cytoplasm chaperone protein [Methylophaga frappieri]
MAEDNAAAQEQQARFIIQKIYTKDISFETPNSPAIFREEWKPTLDLQLGTEHEKIDEENHEIVLVVTVTARVNDKVAFIAEVKQAGIFTLAGYSDDEMGPLIGSYCPNTVFPFAREVVADMVTKGGFPQLVLAPVNFDAVYKRKLDSMAQMREQSAGNPEQTH